MQEEPHNQLSSRVFCCAVAMSMAVVAYENIAAGIADCTEPDSLQAKANSTKDFWNAALRGKTMFGIMLQGAYGDLAMEPLAVTNLAASLLNLGKHLVGLVRKGFADLSSKLSVELVRASQSVIIDYKQQLEDLSVKDGNSLFKETTKEEGKQLNYAWRVYHQCGVTMSASWSAMQRASPMDAELRPDISEWDAMASDAQETDGITKAKSKVAHVAVIQAVFKPLGKGSDREMLVAAAQKNIKALGVTLGPKAAALLSSSGRSSSPAPARALAEGECS